MAGTNGRPSLFWWGDDLLFLGSIAFCIIPAGHRAHREDLHFGLTVFVAPHLTLFRPKRHRLSTTSFRYGRADASPLWTDYAANLAA
ncbi:hypothetical protein [Acidiphilium sp.]|uniref:hypothetical protein n=1 Tax=Acidiphilium sp. TaxID=527 RepID=UPI003CFE1482